jgi:hypothetical protein
VPLKVVWFCTSTPSPSSQNPGELDAYRFLAAIKGQKLKGEAHVPIGDEERRLDNSNLDDAIDWFGENVAAYLERQSIVPPLCFVPLPGSNITLESSTGPWTSLMAMAILTKIQGTVDTADVLRWKHTLPEGQTPSARALYDNIALIRKRDWDMPLVLVGYLTSGAGIIQACAARLRESGAQVSHVIYAGRLVSQPPKEPFAIMQTEIADFDPSSS